MALTRVLLLGSTGETGSAILKGLEEDKNYDIILFIRQASLQNGSVSKLQQRGLRIVTATPEAPVGELASLLVEHAIEVVISAFGAMAQLDQLRWIDAAAQAGIGRFIPCGFTTICPRGGVMLIRDEKEEVHDHIFRQRVPFTIIDVGFWYALSLIPVPSGKLDYVIAMPKLEIYGDGNIPNILIDKPDIGRFVARIARDPRTLNKRVVAYGDELSQHEIVDIEHRLTSEVLTTKGVSVDEVIERRKAAVAAAADTKDFGKLMPVFIIEYVHSKYVRGDNTLANAEYLGYLNARELYPDFKPKSFEAYVQDVLNGKGVKPYAELALPQAHK